jgi:hypothetical protein
VAAVLDGEEEICSSSSPELPRRLHCPSLLSPNSVRLRTIAITSATSHFPTSTTAAGCQRWMRWMEDRSTSYQPANSNDNTGSFAYCIVILSPDIFFAYCCCWWGDVFRLGTNTFLRIFQRLTKEVREKNLLPCNSIVASSHEVFNLPQHRFYHSIL